MRRRQKRPQAADVRNGRALLWLALGAGAVALIGGGVALSVSRAERNNNPGNIDKGLSWKGLDASRTDPRFAVFIAPEWGFRAMARILLGDWREGQNTVRSLINEWAPPSENDTGAYVKAVAKELRVLPDGPIDVPSRLRDLLRAIARVEAGGVPASWTDAVIDRGILLERAA